MIEMNELEPMKVALNAYYTFVRQEQNELMQSLYLDEQLCEECKISGINYESIGDGCSVSFPKGSYCDQLINEIATHDIQAQRYKRMWKIIESQMRLSDRFKVLSGKKKKYIIAVYKDKKRITELAKKEGISRQAYTDRIDVAIREMLEVEL